MLQAPLQPTGDQPDPQRTPADEEECCGEVKARFEMRLAQPEGLVKEVVTDAPQQPGREEAQQNFVAPADNRAGIGFDQFLHELIDQFPRLQTHGELQLTSFLPALVGRPVNRIKPGL